MATQNIYDAPAFFDAYAALARQVDGLDSAPEWPALRRLLPADLRGKDVLDLGCGFGWYSRWFTGEAEAASARGVDISEKMLARAREMTPGSGSGAEGAHGTGTITFDRADLEDVELPSGAYDLVFSALALHYVSGLGRLLAEVHRSLRPGGAVVFSVEHPLLTAPRRQGFIKDAEGVRYWPLDDYHDEGERVSNWLGSSVRKQHRSTATYVNLLLRAGFDITGFEDWCPELTEEFRNSAWGNNWIRTSFLLIGAVKR
jgi:SAM-dependent methyltransferase